jgi:plastocyanin
MMTVIQYRGVMPSGPIAENWNPETGGLAVPSKDPSMGMGHALHHAADPASGAPETPSAEAPAPAGEVVVALADNRYVPGSITVTAGTTVTFHNAGGNWHSVKGNGGAIDSGSIESGGSWSYTFDEPGVFKLICIQHIRQGMSGEVIVVAADE